MDFSSIPRALESLERRQPPLAPRTVELASQLSTESDPKAFVAAVVELMSIVDESAGKLRWEPLAVGLCIAEQVLSHQLGDENGRKIYMEGPRLPAMIDSEAKDRFQLPRLTTEQALELVESLHAIAMDNIEHSEPRVRTLVAKAVGAYCQVSFAAGGDRSMSATINERLIDSIHAHIETGRDENGNYSRASTGALDDTTGWRALETNWQCLAALSSALGPDYLSEFAPSEQLLIDCEYSAVKHVNRHVRAAAMAVLEQWVTSAATPEHEHLLKDATSKLRTTTVAVLRTGLADNWSQVRMAASVLCRVLFLKLDEIGASPEDLYPPLLPRMCLNRFYLAQGVKLYSHETWRMVMKDRGMALVAENLPAVVRYYVKMCDADNHVVREAACQAIAELATRLGSHPEYHELIKSQIDLLLQALLMCFHDESWPVRDEACLACGLLCKSYPEECRPELKTLWDRWTEQLTDQIWSVREDAAVALGDALEGYGEEVFEKIRTLIRKILPAAKDQPAMTQAEYKAHQNDFEQHTDSQLYSCGSLAPKLRKGGAGRIGCSNCGINRPKAPWEATDGCIYLIRELVIHGTNEGTRTPISDDELLPLLRELADVCRVQHFPQSNDLRATLWRTLPIIAQALGKQRFKRLYLDVFMDLLFSNLESRTASELSIHAAGQCAEELANLVGMPIFRGRLDDYQRDTFDRTMREREMMPKGPADAAAFSPFGPPGLLDTVGGTGVQTAFPGRA